MAGCKTDFLCTLIFLVVIISLTLITFYVDDELVLSGENWCWSLFPTWRIYPATWNLSDISVNLLFSSCLLHVFIQFYFYSQTSKTLNTWNTCMAGMFIVFRTCELVTNHKLINILACSVVSHTWLPVFLQHNNIPEIFLVFMVFDCLSLFEIMYIWFCYSQFVEHHGRG